MKMIDNFTSKQLEASQSERAALEAMREKTEQALRAELDQTRAELMQTQAQAAELQQELATVRATPTEEPRRRWWRS
jgi:ribosomal protein L29